MKVTIEQPKAIVLDFMSTAIKSGFIEKGLYAYLRKYGLRYIEQSWAQKNFHVLMKELRAAARREQPLDEGMPRLLEATEPMALQQKALYDNMIWFLDMKKETPAHYKLKFMIYEDGYEKERITTHVYTDVANNMQKWKAMGVKLYILSSAWTASQKMFMKRTNHGNLSECIEGYFDTNFGKTSQPETFNRLAKEIGEREGDMVFLTKSVEQGRAAKEAGIHSILCISHSAQLKRYDREDLKSFARIRSFDELRFKGEPEPVEPEGHDEHAEGGGYTGPEGCPPPGVVGDGQPDE